MNRFIFNYILFLIIWILTLFIFKKYLLISKNICINLIIIFLPIILIIIQLNNYTKLINDNKINILNSYIKEDIKMTHVIPVIIFGVAMLLSRHSNYSKKLAIIVPFFILSLLFSIVIPTSLKFIFHKNNLNINLLLNIYIYIILGYILLFYGIIYCLI